MVSYALLHTMPPIKDPKELNTIILTSIRSMFGECQSYTVGLTVIDCRRRRHPNQLPGTTHLKSNSHDSYEAVIECPTNFLPYIRAALTFPSPPSYLSDTMYCIDFIEVVDDTRPTWAELDVR